MPEFQLVTDLRPTGDQPKAIAQLVEGLQRGYDQQTLLGVTGSGKTFTMANVIQAVQRPTLVLAPNKTLAAQLYSEFKEFFPHNAVEYFVSYYDYYQPEAYVPRTDTYIEKDAEINDEIDKLRHAASAADPPGRHHRRQRLLHLRHRLPRRVREDDRLPAPGRHRPARQGAAPSGRDPVRA